MMIPLSEYAKQHGRDMSTARHKALKGGFNTARKIGRIWMIDDSEPWVDNRVRVKDDEPANPFRGTFDPDPNCLSVFTDIPSDWYAQYTAKQLGEIAVLLKQIYDKGVAYGREHP